MRTEAARLSRANSYHETFLTSDLDEARHYIGQALKPHALTLLDRRQSLSVKVGRTGLGQVSFMYIHHGADVLVKPGKLETLFLFQVPVHATRQEVRVGSSVINVSPGIAYVASPTLDFELKMSKQCDNVVLAVERGRLETYLEQQLQRRLDKPLEFKPRIELHNKECQELVALMSHFTKQLNSHTPGLKHHIIQTQAEALLISTMLINLEHNYRDELLCEATTPKPYYIKRAQAYILENAHTTLTPQEIATEVCISLRSLYAGFQAFLHCTPMAYIKGVKLDKIRHELQLGAADETSVADVASKYGICSLGNFAASYRRRFGELPRDTLLKGRSLS